MTSRRRHTLIDTSKFNAMSVAIISSAAMVMGAAHAQMTAPSSRPSASSPDTTRYLEAFDRCDKNGDGKLSKEEADSLPAIAQRFAQIDADKDGFISKAEYLDALKP